VTISVVLLRGCRMLDRSVTCLALAFAWLALPLLILLTVLNVAGRWIPLGGMEAFYDLGSDLFFTLVMLSFGYAYVADGHVRVDVVRGRLSPRRIASIELLGCLGIVIPLSWFLVDFGLDAARHAFSQGERGVGDLPLQWVVRASVPLGFLGLLLAAASAAIRNALFLLGAQVAPAPAPEGVGDRPGGAAA